MFFKLDICFTTKAIANKSGPCPKSWAVKKPDENFARSEAGSRKFTEYQKIGGAANAIFNSKVVLKTCKFPPQDLFSTKQLNKNNT